MNAHAEMLNSARRKRNTTFSVYADAENLR